jgi:heme/copper-type cytochrome/quinol oxidase subunit 2
MPNKAKSEKLKVKSNFFFLLSIFYSLSTSAQCAMCRASLESSGDTKQVEAVNDGIVFLMAIPYILVAVLGFVVYRMFNKNK